MTHVELRSRYRGPGLEPTSCPGELEVRDAAIDRDPVDGHRVIVYRCKLCGHIIPLDETEGRVRNDYPDSRGNREP